MAGLATELEQLDIKTSRGAREFYAFIVRESVRWDPPARRVLLAEGRRAALGYEAGGEPAALAAVTDPPWRKYMDRVWLSTVPRAGDLVSEQLVKAAPPDLFLQAAVRWLRLNGGQHIQWITDTSRSEISNQIRIGVEKGESRSEIAARIVAKRRLITPWRSELIARTEVHAAANYGSLVAAGDVRVTMRKIWVARSGARPTHGAASGQRQPLAAAFSVGGYSLEFPGDTSQGAPADEICNCRCVMAYEVDRARRVPDRPRRAA